MESDILNKMTHWLLTADLLVERHNAITGVKAFSLTPIQKKRQNSMVVTIELKASVTSTPEEAVLMDD